VRHQSAQIWFRMNIPVGTSVSVSVLEELRQIATPEFFDLVDDGISRYVPRVSKSVAARVEEAAAIFPFASLWK
jgi:hypothetical protein